MEAGGSRDCGRPGAGWRGEHRLRNEISRISIALRLARGALASGDRSTLEEMLAEAEDAAKGCRDVLGSRSVMLQSAGAGGP